MKWLDVLEQPKRPGQVTRRWALVPKGDAVRAIGWVSWYAPWRKYAFTPEPLSVYEPDCLRDIATFCEERTAERKAEREAQRNAH